MNALEILMAVGGVTLGTVAFVMLGNRSDRLRSMTVSWQESLADRVLPYGMRWRPNAYPARAIELPGEHGVRSFAIPVDVDGRAAVALNPAAYEVLRPELDPVGTIDEHWIVVVGSADQRDRLLQHSAKLEIAVRGRHAPTNAEAAALRWKHIALESGLPEGDLHDMEQLIIQEQ